MKRSENRIAGFKKREPIEEFKKFLRKKKIYLAFMREWRKDRSGWNLIPSSSAFDHWMKIGSPRDAVRGAFVFVHTEEGQDFWEKIDKEWKRYFDKVHEKDNVR